MSSLPFRSLVFIVLISSVPAFAASVMGHLSSEEVVYTVEGVEGEDGDLKIIVYSCDVSQKEALFRVMKVGGESSRLLAEVAKESIEEGKSYCKSHGELTEGKMTAFARRHRQRYIYLESVLGAAVEVAGQKLNKNPDEPIIDLTASMNMHFAFLFFDDASGLSLSNEMNGSSLGAFRYLEPTDVERMLWKRYSDLAASDEVYYASAVDEISAQLDFAPYKDAIAFLEERYDDIGSGAEARIAKDSQLLEEAFGYSFNDSKETIPPQKELEIEMMTDGVVGDILRRKGDLLHSADDI